MVVLKKIRGATLLETVIASVIILVVFVVATTTINNVFYNAILNDSIVFQNHTNELHYLTIHNKVTIPYFEETEDWEITIEQTKDNRSLHAVLKKNGTIINHLIANE